MLRTALLDVGGTLWPDRLPPVRGAIESEPPLTSAADAVVTDLDAVRHHVALWCA